MVHSWETAAMQGLRWLMGVNMASELCSTAYAPGCPPSLSDFCLTP